MAEYIREGVAARRTVWAAVFAGVVIALVVQFSLTVLGLGIGAASFDPLSESHPASGLGIGSALWLGITALVSLFAGGWVAGRLAAAENRVDGTLHGVVTWGLASLVSVFLVSTAVGKVVSGGASILGSVLGAAGRGAAAIAPRVAETVSGAIGGSDLTLADVKSEARKLLRQTRKPELQPKNLERRADRLGQAAAVRGEAAAKNPQSAGAELDALLDRVYAQGKAVASAADKDAIVNVLVARTDMSRDEASRTVDRWDRTIQKAKVAVTDVGEQAEEKAREVADAAARGVSKAAIWTFVGLLLGLGAAAWGAYLGSPEGRVASGMRRWEREAA